MTWYKEEQAHPQPAEPQVKVESVEWQQQLITKDMAHRIAFAVKYEAEERLPHVQGVESLMLQGRIEACDEVMEVIKEAKTHPQPAEPTINESLSVAELTDERNNFESWWVQMPETSAFDLSTGEDEAYNDTSVQRCWIAWQAKADRALRAPDGWVMVSREITPKMDEAGYKTLPNKFKHLGYGLFRNYYKAMIAAAPKQGGQT